jgi:NAD(P)-dependent dehydrogenase (short-subunit alcohol dehydrogenase family)
VRDPIRGEFVRGCRSAVAFLLGAQSSYLTGTELVVDGGLSAVVPMPPRS